MEWKNYDQNSRVFPALLTLVLCVSVRGDAREVQDRVLALNEGDLDVHAWDNAHMSKPTEAHLTPCIWRRGNHSILGEGLGVGKKNFRKFSLSHLPGVSFIWIMVLFSLFSPCILPTEGLWVGSLTSLSLSFCSYKMGLRIAIISWRFLQNVWSVLSTETQTSMLLIYVSFLLHSACLSPPSRLVPNSFIPNGIYYWQVWTYLSVFPHQDSLKFWSRHSRAIRKSEIRILGPGLHFEKFLLIWILRPKRSSCPSYDLQRSARSERSSKFCITPSLLFPRGPQAWQ